MAKAIPEAATMAWFAQVGCLADDDVWLSVIFYGEAAHKDYPEQSGKYRVIGTKYLEKRPEGGILAVTVPCFRVEYDYGKMLR
jgi:hypothetical protein